MRTYTAALGALALASVAAAQQVLLMPNSLRDTVWTLDPFDGSVLSQNFITDPNHVTTINAIDSGRGTVFVSDQVADAVFEYDLNGNFLGTFVGAGEGLDNIRGIAVKDGDLYVTVAGGGLAGTIQKFRIADKAQSTFISLPTGANSPWDITFRANDVLISDSATDDIYSYTHAGTLNGKFYDSPGTNDLNFPQQIALAGTDVLVAGFSVPNGIYRFDENGIKTAFRDTGIAVRGVYQLGNGKVLWTGGTRFGTWDPVTNSLEDIYTGTTSDSFRYVELMAVPEPGTLAALGLAALLLRRRRSSR